MYLFGYSTLNDLQVQKRIWGKVLNGVPDVLPGYRREIRGKDFHNAVPDTGKRNIGIHGNRYEITPTEYEKVIEWERDYYKPVPLKLKSGKSAIVFILREGVKLPK